MLMLSCLLQAERPGGGLVAVKALSLRSMGDWKQLELFEREAAALRSLSHPRIPAYKDYFEVDSDGDRAYFLVQVSQPAPRQLLNSRAAYCSSSANHQAQQDDHPCFSTPSCWRLHMQHFGMTFSLFVCSKVYNLVCTCVHSGRQMYHGMM